MPQRVIFGAVRPITSYRDLVECFTRHLIEIKKSL
jgi:hypothetical protein